MIVFAEQGIMLRRQAGEAETVQSCCGLGKKSQEKSASVLRRRSAAYRNLTTSLAAFSPRCSTLRVSCGEHRAMSSSSFLLDQNLLPAPVLLFLAK